jgi:hypothetical protein
MGRGFQLTGDGISVLELSPLLYGMVARNIGGTTKLLWRKKNNALFNRRRSHPQVDVIHQLVVLIFAIIGFCLNAPPTYTQTGTQWKASTSDLGITPDYLNG